MAFGADIHCVYMPCGYLMWEYTVCRYEEDTKMRGDTGGRLYLVSGPILDEVRKVNQLGK